MRTAGGPRTRITTRRRSFDGRAASRIWANELPATYVDFRSICRGLLVCVRRRWFGFSSSSALEGFCTQRSRWPRASPLSGPRTSLLVGSTPGRSAASRSATSSLVAGSWPRPGSDVGSTVAERERSRRHRRAVAATGGTSVALFNRCCSLPTEYTDRLHMDDLEQLDSKAAVEGLPPAAIVESDDLKSMFLDGRANSWVR